MSIIQIVIGFHPLSAIIEPLKGRARDKHVDLNKRLTTFA
jgi:hypothetical protein